jgi:riboflavin kinase/FMN adenylyltransferase
MLNLGPRPTFGDAEVLLEAHLFDAQVELYGAWVRVDIVGRLRETVRFDSPAALQRQLAADEAQARALLAGSALR